MTVQLAKESSDVEAAPEPGPVRIPWAPIPKVNLLPIEIIENRRFRRTQILLGAAVLGAVALAGAGVVWAQQGVGTANDELAASEFRVSNLQNEQTRYADVPLVLAQVDAATAARTQAMGTDVLWYRYLNDIRGAQPADVKLDSLSLTLTAATTTATGTDALSVAGIGTVTTTGTAAEYSQVSAWLEALNKLNGTSSSSLSNAAKAAVAADPKKAVTFAVGAVITSDALSNRYVKKAG